MLDKIPSRGMFKLLSIIYLQNVCILVVLINALLRFLNVFGITVPVLVIRKNILSHCMYNDLTKRWSTKWYKII